MSSLYWPQCATYADSGIPKRESSGPPSDFRPPYSPTQACDVLAPCMPRQCDNIMPPFRTYLKELVYESSDGNRQVFRAVLCQLATQSGLGGLTSERWDVVCKVAYGERRIEALQREANIYNTKLLQLQGSTVPVMYGCYMGNTEDGSTAVLILQYCGIPLSYELRGYKVAFRVQIASAFVAIHKAGLIHLDVSERNILVSKGKDGNPHVTIIDFEMADEHTCPVKVDTIVPYQIPSHFSCPEIQAVIVEEAELFLPDSFVLFKQTVPASVATSLEAVLRYTGIPEHMDQERAMIAANSAFREFIWERETRLGTDAHPAPIEWDAGDDDEDWIQRGSVCQWLLVFAVSYDNS
ncbi:hypothetical protein NUW54_g10241 [Trametes sanguinea]|uniref:Uncharacterized protein n=1 Tax=Trametes sanguinea TaxID=158606 RepID=A0ACC1P3H3_9APHY|nr:hypothetical protein NUW54_g10241 [Trametes sanguinea]